MSRRAASQSGIEKHFGELERERQARDEREARKQRAIDEGDLSDLDAPAENAPTHDGPTSAVRARRVAGERGVSGGGRSQRKGKKPLRPLTQTCSNCLKEFQIGPNVTADVSVCPYCGTDLPSKTKGRPKGPPTKRWTFEITSGFAALIANSQQSNAGTRKKAVGVRDFLQFWLDVRTEHFFSGERSTPAGWPHMWRQVGQKTRKPGKRGRDYKWGDREAIKIHELVECALLDALRAEGVDVGKGQRPRKSIPRGPAWKSELERITPTVNDIAMTGLGFFHTARFAFLSRFGPRLNPATEPIDYDENSTNTTEIALVVRELRTYSEKWRKGFES